MNNKSICFIGRGSINGSVETIINLNRHLHDHFSNTFDSLIFCDVSRVFTTRFKYGGEIKDNPRDLLSSKYEIVTPHNLREFKDFLKSRDMVVICNFSEEWHDYYIHYYLKKYNIPLVYIHTHSTIANFYQQKEKQSLLTKIINKVKSVINFHPKVDLFFLSKKDEYKRVIASKRYLKPKTVVLTNSHVYDQWLDNKENVSDEHIVFLDSMVPYHRDQIKYGHKLINKDLYYKKLNLIFDYFEKVLQKEVVVCLFPKYDEKNKEKDFGSRRAVKYRTDEFIAKSSLVLFHETSAINNAVLYKKKSIQLTGSQFSEFIKKNCDIFKEIFNFPTLDMYTSGLSEVNDVIRASNFQQQDFQDFLDNFLLASKEEGISSSEQISNVLKERYFNKETTWEAETLSTTIKI